MDDEKVKNLFETQAKIMIGLIESNSKLLEENLRLMKENDELRKNPQGIKLFGST